MVDTRGVRAFFGSPDQHLASGLTGSHEARARPKVHDGVPSTEPPLLGSMSVETALRPAGSPSARQRG